MSKKSRILAANVLAGVAGVLVATVFVENNTLTTVPPNIHAAALETSSPLSLHGMTPEVGYTRMVIDGDRRSVARFAKVMKIDGALAERAALLDRTVTVHFSMGSGTVVATGAVALREHPSWIQLLIEPGASHAFLNYKRIYAGISAAPELAKNLPRAKNCMMQDLQKDSYGVQRSTLSCFAKDGYLFDEEIAAKALERALSEGWETVDIPVTLKRGIVVDNATEQGGYLSLLAEGKSRFKGSPLGRKANISKAVKEKIHGVVIPAGAEFSFNATLGGPVDVSTGWFMALGIFEGDQLRPTPGGGVCQVSTTVYRAALAAGLPITAQRNHSMFVGYYEAYGVGQDSTIFPGQQDLMFKNDTSGPILIQAQEDGKEVTVRFYGAPDGRTVEMQGPYFSAHGSKRLAAEFGDNLGYRQIGWKRTVLRSGITDPQIDHFVSTYKTIPKDVAWRWMR